MFVYKSLHEVKPHNNIWANSIQCQLHASYIQPTNPSPKGMLSPSGRVQDREASVSGLANFCVKLLAEKLRRPRWRPRLEMTRSKPKWKQWIWNIHISWSRLLPKSNLAPDPCQLFVDKAGLDECILLFPGYTEHRTASAFKKLGNRKYRKHKRKANSPSENCNEFGRHHF